MPEEGNGGGGGTPQKCFDWFGTSWGKDFPGWKEFRQALIDHGADVNTWIDAHPSAASCIHAVKDQPPPGPPPGPPPPPPPTDRYCFEWFGQKWGQDHPGWRAFKQALLDHGADPNVWAKNHPDAAKCIGAPPPPSPPPPPNPPPAPPPNQPPPGPPPPPAGASWTRTDGPWLFVESDPSSFRSGAWTRLDVTQNEIPPDIPVWRCPGGLVPNSEGSQEGPVRDWIPGNWNTADSIAPVTTLGIDAAAFAELGVTSCMVECYLQGQANALDKYGQAFREGWLDAIPVIGVGFAGDNGTFHVADYADWLKQFGRRFAVYATDPMSDQDWTDLAAIVAGAPAIGAPPLGGPGAPPPGSGGGTSPAGLHYCFQWGGQYWGGDYPGWDEFKAWLEAHGANPTTWINTHLDAAVCINAPGAAQAQAGPGGGGTQATTDTRYQYFYTHLADRGLPTAGDAVDKGQVIGYVMKAPDTANHTHLGVHRPDGPNNVGVPFPKEAGPVHPGEKPAADFTTDHPTGGLDGYPAHDFPAPAGTKVLAVESGFIDRISGHNESEGDVDPALHVYGHNIYLTAYADVYQPPPGSPVGTPPTSIAPKPAPTSKFKEPPATVAAWTALKRTFSRKVPATRSAASAIIDNPRAWLK